MAASDVEYLLDGHVLPRPEPYACRSRNVLAMVCAAVEAWRRHLHIDRADSPKFSTCPTISASGSTRSKPGNPAASDFPELGHVHPRGPVIRCQRDEDLGVHAARVVTGRNGRPGERARDSDRRVDRAEFVLGNIFRIRASTIARALRYARFRVPDGRRKWQLSLFRRPSTGRILAYHRQEKEADCDGAANVPTVNHRCSINRSTKRAVRAWNRPKYCRVCR